MPVRGLAHVTGDDDGVRLLVREELQYFLRSSMFAPESSLIGPSTPSIS